MNRLRVKVLGLGDSEVPMRKFVSLLASLIPERLLLALNRFPRIRWAIKHFVTKGGSCEVEAIRLDTLLEQVGKPDLILELHRAAGLRPPYQRLLEAGYRISTPGRLDSIGEKLESYGRVHVMAEP